jgi:hypothetical protein
MDHEQPESLHRELTVASELAVEAGRRILR